MRRSFQVRPIRWKDLDAIMKIEHASFGVDAYDRNLFAKYLTAADTGGVLFLAAERGWVRRSVRGYSLAVASGDRGEIVSIAVMPSDRRKGVARLLMESTLRRLKRRGVERVSLTVKAGNLGARRLYEDYGFRKVRTVRAYYEDGADGVRMVRT